MEEGSPAFSAFRLAWLMVRPRAAGVCVARLGRPIGPRRVLRWEAYAPVLQRGFDGIEASDSEDPQRS
jgi:hypothetical protein